MPKFVKGHKKVGGKSKGAKNKATLLFEGLTDENKRIIFEQAMKLVKKGNVTIINKFLDKLFANAIPVLDNGETEDNDLMFEGWS